MNSVAAPAAVSISLRVRRANRGVRRAAAKGRDEKARALLSAVLSSDWHPLGRQVAELAGMLRARLEAEVRPEGGPAEFEPLVASLKAALQSMADALPVHFGVDPQALPWFAHVCDAVFNTANTFEALFDAYAAVYCRLDSRLLDMFQQMSNLQMAHLGIASSLWRFDCSKAVDLMRTLRGKSFARNHLSSMLHVLTQTAAALTEGNTSVGGDDFLLLFQWVVMSSKLPHSYSTLCVLRDWLNESMGQTAYIVCTFEVTLASLQNFCVKDAMENAEQCKIDPRDFPQIE